MTTIVPVGAVGTTRTVAAGGAAMINGHRWDGEDGRGWYDRDDYDPSPWLWLEIAQDRTRQAICCTPTSMLTGPRLGLRHADQPARYRFELLSEP